jgi:hypothetical protein
VSEKDGGRRRWSRAVVETKAARVSCKLEVGARTDGIYAMARVGCWLGLGLVYYCSLALAAGFWIPATPPGRGRERSFPMAGRPGVRERQSPVVDFNRSSRGRKGEVAVSSSGGGGRLSLSLVVAASV